MANRRRLNHDKGRTDVKHYHENFNKRSRLTRAPEIVASPVTSLAAMDPKQLKFRIASALQIQNDYFPCFDWTFPPPVAQKTRGTLEAAQLFRHASVVPGKYSVYMHIPFCASLCKFCYYPVIPGQRDAESATYVDYLVREMALYSEACAGSECESVYIGGGTPTHLTNPSLERLFDGIHRHFRLAQGAEITVESAPGTLTRDKVALLKDRGVNRLSYGIQTLDTALLADLNRNYTVEGAIAELEHAVAEIGNVNIDTMYGFEGESDHALLDTLRRFLAIGVPCVSIYSLDGQRCNTERVRYEPGKDPMFEKKLAIFRQARDLLADNGFAPVLQNIFLRPGVASYRHQLRRWENVPLVALGLASMGYAPRVLYQNQLSMKNYYASIDAGALPIMESESLSAEMEMAREVVSQLRFTQVDMGHIQAKYGVEISTVYRDLISALTELGYLEVRAGVLRLTDKATPYNNILPMLFAPDAFKHSLFGLPEEFREKFPLPYVLTNAGATQSCAIALGDG
jgi:oxygen-independent coproporphyrinogen-3 oxidase